MDNTFVSDAKYYVYENIRNLPKKWSDDEVNKFTSNSNDDETNVLLESKILQGDVFSNPLDQPLMRSVLRDMNLNFNDLVDLWVHHRFVILHCKKANDELFWMSVDKNKDGIIFKIDYENADIIKNYAINVKENMYELRYGGKAEIAQLSTMNLQVPLELLNNTTEDFGTVRNLITYLKRNTELNYNGLLHNCQTLTNLVECHLNDVKTKVSLKFPGTTSTISFSRDKMKNMIELVDHYYPGIDKKEFTNVPCLPEPNTLVPVEKTALKGKVRNHYKNLEIRDKVNYCLHQILSSGKVFTKKLDDIKVFVTNLSKTNLHRKLQEVNKDTMSEGNDILEQENGAYLSNEQCQRIAAFWTEVFHSVFISQDVGIIIFNVITGHLSNDDLLSNTYRIHIIKTLLNFEVNTDRHPDKYKIPITVIPVKVGAHDHISEEELNRFCEKNNSIDKDCKLWNYLKDEIKGIHKEEKMCKIDKKQLKYFLSKVIILQNLQNASTLIFNRIINQEWMGKYYYWIANFGL